MQSSDGTRYRVIGSHPAARTLVTGSSLRLGISQDFRILSQISFAVGVSILSSLS